MKIVHAISGMIRGYTFVFTPEPEGGSHRYLPRAAGLATYRESLPAAREMARDAMERLIEALLEWCATIPDSDAPDTLPRFNQLAHWLREEAARPRVRAVDGDDQRDGISRLPSLLPNDSSRRLRRQVLSYCTSAGATTRFSIRPKPPHDRLPPCADTPRAAPSLPSSRRPD